MTRGRGDGNGHHHAPSTGRGGGGGGRGAHTRSEAHEAHGNGNGSGRGRPTSPPHGGQKGGNKGGGRSRGKRNTETFDPSHEPTDMRIVMDTAGSTPDKAQYTRPYHSNEVIVLRDLFPEEGIYARLVAEMEASGIDDAALWKLWHGDSHVIADDKLGWKNKCPTFCMVIERLTRYFQVDVKATRFNWYRDSSEWKPYHHDAAAVKPDKARLQNITIGVSFGAERDASFEHAKTKTTVSMPLPDGSVYVFARDVNVEWRHGILQVPSHRESTEGRISIIAWGWVDMEGKFV